MPTDPLDDLRSSRLSGRTPARTVVRPERTLAGGTGARTITRTDRDNSTIEARLSGVSADPSGNIDYNGITSDSPGMPSMPQSMQRTLGTAYPLQARSAIAHDADGNPVNVPGVDLTATREELVKKRFAFAMVEEAERMGVEHLDVQQKRDLRQKLRVEAHTEVRVWAESSHGSPFSFNDRDPGVVTEGLAESGWDGPGGLFKSQYGWAADSYADRALSGVRHITSPIGAWLNPHTMHTYESVPVTHPGTGEITHYRPKFGESHARKGVWSTIMWATYGLDGVVATARASGEEKKKELDPSYEPGKASGWDAWMDHPSARLFMAPMQMGVEGMKATLEGDNPSEQMSRVLGVGGEAITEALGMGSLDTLDSILTGWGSKKHVTKIQNMEDSFTEASRIGEMTPGGAVGDWLAEKDYVSDRTADVWRMLNGVGMGLGYAMVSPDPLFSTLDVLGKGSRALKSISVGRQADKTEAMADGLDAHLAALKALEEIDHGDEYGSELATLARTIIEDARTTDKQLADALEMQIRSGMSTMKVASGGTFRAMQFAALARDRAATLIVQANAAALKASDDAIALHGDVKPLQREAGKYHLFSRFKDPVVQDAVGKAEFQAAVAKNLADIMVLRDAQAMKKAMSGLYDSKDAAKYKAGEGELSAQRIQRLWEQLAEAKGRANKATNIEDYEKIAEESAHIQHAIRRELQAGVQSGIGHSTRIMDETIAAAAKAVEESKAAVKGISQAGRKAHLKLRKRIARSLTNDVAEVAGTSLDTTSLLKVYKAAEGKMLTAQRHVRASNKNIARRKAVTSDEIVVLQDKLSESQKAMDEAAAVINKMNKRLYRTKTGAFPKAVKAFEANKARVERLTALIAKKKATGGSTPAMHAKNTALKATLAELDAARILARDGYAYAKGATGQAQRRLVKASQKVDDASDMVHLFKWTDLTAHEKAAKSLMVGARMKAEGEMVSAILHQTLKNTSDSFRAGAAVLRKGKGSSKYDARYTMRRILSMSKKKGKAVDVLRYLEDTFGVDAVMRVEEAGSTTLQRLRLAAKNDTYSTVSKAAVRGFVDQLVMHAKNIESEPHALWADILRAKKGQDYVNASQANYAFLRKIQKTFYETRRSLSRLTDPARDYLGAVDDSVVLQIGKGMITRMRVMQSDVDKIMKASEKAADKVSNLTEFITRGDGVVSSGARVLSNRGYDVSLWHSARAFMRSALKSDDAVPAEVEALSKMWIPTGLAGGVAEKHGAALMAYAKKILLEGADLGFEDFSKLISKKTENLLDVPQTLINTDAETAIGYAAQAIGQAAIIERSTRQLTARLIDLPPEAFTSAVNLTARNTGDVDDYKGAIKIFDRLGLPSDLAYQTRNAAEDMRAGLTLLEGLGPEGRNAIIPTQWMTKMRNEMRPIIKRLENAANAEKDTALAGRIAAAQQMFRIWSASITSGVGFTRPAYFANMIFGNFSQIWAEEGIGQAMRSTAHAGTALAEGGGRQIMKWSSQRLGKGNKKMQWLGNQIDLQYAKNVQNNGNPGVLASPSNAIYNPHVSAFFDPARAADDLVITRADGDTITMGELRRYAAGEDVLTSYTSEGFRELIERNMDDSKGAGLHTLGSIIFKPTGEVMDVTGGMRSPQDMAGAAVSAAKKFAPFVGEKGAMGLAQARAAHWAEVADVVEQRQRVALFTDLIVNKGYSPSEAGKVVREALYDWSHSATEAEARTVGQIGLFFRFWRLSLRQGMRATMAPFTRAFNGEGTLQTLASGKGTRVSQQAESVRAVQSVAPHVQTVEDENGEQISLYEAQQKEAEELGVMWSEMYPWWSAKTPKPFLSNGPVSTADADWAERERGKSITHRATVAPAMTILDTASLGLNAIANLGAVVLSDKAPSAAIREGLLNPVAGMLNPVLGNALSNFSDDYMGGRSFPMSDPKLKQTEKGTLGVTEAGLNVVERLFGMEETDLTFQYPDDPSGTMRTTPGIAALYRMIPVLGTEVTSWMDPFLAVHDGVAAGNKAEAFSYLLRQLTGVGRQYDHNPEEAAATIAKYEIGEHKARSTKELKRQKPAGIDWAGRSSKNEEEEEAAANTRPAYTPRSAGRSRTTRSLRANRLREIGER